MSIRLFQTLSGSAILNKCKPLLLTISILMLLTILGTRVASASPFELYGMGSRAAALGNVGSASAKDYSAVHYNPGALLSGRSSLGGGLSYAFKDLDVRLSPRPKGYDIPNLGAASPAVPSEFELRNRQGEQDRFHSFTLFTGLSSDLGTENLRVGFLLSLPVYHSVKSYPSTFSDERLGSLNVRHPPKKRIAFFQKLCAELQLRDRQSLSRKRL